MEVYTIGHSTHPLQKFVSLLKSRRIEAVVDVRSEPYSRHAPQYNKESLEALLPRSGIEYLFIADDTGNLLGGRPSDPECYAEGKPSYDLVRKKAWYSMGISELTKIAKTKRTALMCAEEDPEKCHRSRLLEPSLREKGFNVVHIRADEKQEKKKTSPQTTLDMF